jgi:3-phosphoshikimate 1-carboxyvinyltransferase
MNLTLQPGRPLRGELTLPADKSLSHRAALLSAMACGRSRVAPFLQAGVTQVLLDAITQLGVEWSLEDGVLTLRSPGYQAWRAPANPLWCGNSATTLRLLAGALAASGLPAVLDGSPGLRRRPMARVVEPLRAMGAPFTPGETAPLTLLARSPAQPLRGLTYHLPVASAQVKSALLLAGLAAGSLLTLTGTGWSRDHTERLLAHLGVDVQVELADEPGGCVTLHPPASPLPPLDLTLPGDFSSAAFLIVAAAISPGSCLTLPGVGLNPTRTGLLDALQAMGADITVQPQPDAGGEPVGCLTVRHAPLTGTTVAGSLVTRMIDEFPAFAVAACFARGETVVRDAAELRHKESDRITVLAGLLRAAGADFTETPAGFAIRGRGNLSGNATLDPHGDHRLAMALAVAGLAADHPLTVRGAEIIAESFPGFPATLRALGADLTEEAA